MITCLRCKKKGPPQPDCWAVGWASPFFGGFMCPKCYEKLMELRAKHDARWRATFNKFMHKKGT